jgi:hypothetical protein
MFKKSKKKGGGRGGNKKNNGKNSRKNPRKQKFFNYKKTILRKPTTNAKRKKTR